MTWVVCIFVPPRASQAARRGRRHRRQAKRAGPGWRGAHADTPGRAARHAGSSSSRGRGCVIARTPRSRRTSRCRSQASRACGAANRRSKRLWFAALLSKHGEPLEGLSNLKHGSLGVRVVQRVGFCPRLLRPLPPMSRIVPHSYIHHECQHIDPIRVPGRCVEILRMMISYFGPRQSVPSDRRALRSGAC
jgi:hypothetical protein